ncbi:UDP-glucose/GDP-mannose dehydrogenase family protein [Neobacillus niacini]|uniref:UDP-glucose dehydrogenase family protein n=1 Tax=Neobacillus niacini TaxID=86668 RepID=UPI00300019B4
MKIAVLGTGYVGLSTGVCLSQIGHQVTCLDINERKINQLRQGISPIYEPNLEELLTSNMAAGRLQFTTSQPEALVDAEIIIIAVGTPQGDDGAADLTYLVQAAKEITSYITQETIIVIKSTVPVGTNAVVKKLIEDRTGTTVKMVSNPEFLRQGSAIEDTMKADRIIIGSENELATRKIEEMYQPLNVPVIVTSTKSAEMIKYASNAFLATKISYINEMANLCEAVGANVADVARGMGKDRRIGEAFLNAGIGYGGSCFPKDVKALLHTAEVNGVEFPLLKETIAINERQREWLVAKALKRFGHLSGKKIAMLGLAFKPETDDMREAPSIPISAALSKWGAEVIAYDPVATENAKKLLGDSIKYAGSIAEAVYEADAVFIVTEWNEIKNQDLVEMIRNMKEPIIFDGRNCFSEDEIRACSAIEYYPIGKPSIII